MSRRNILIPPLIDASGQSVSVTVGVSLVDGSGAQIAGYTDSTGIVEPIIVTAGNDGTTLSLVPQSEISGASYYAISLVSKHRRASYKIQVPAGDTPIQLQELLSFTDRVDSACLLYDRLLPDPKVLADGKWMTTLDGEWISIDAPQGAGDMYSLVYDPNGVRSNVFNIANLTGDLDGGTF